MNFCSESMMGGMSVQSHVPFIKMSKQKAWNVFEVGLHKNNVRMRVNTFLRAINQMSVLSCEQHVRQ